MPTFQHTAARRRLAPSPTCRSVLTSFNTQPPEGGWHSSPPSWRYHQSFNTQPPEGGWIVPLELSYFVCSFNTQPPEGGWDCRWLDCCAVDVSTHSRPKAAGQRRDAGLFHRAVSTHSRPKAAGEWTAIDKLHAWFQHTAARRRLVQTKGVGWTLGSGFNTQPPEGGWGTVRAPFAI